MHSLKTLVTEGAGFVGSHLVDRLMKEGYEVTVLDDFSAGKVENIKRHSDSRSFHLVKDDVRNSYADVSKAEMALGYKPEVRLEEGIRLLLQGLDV